MINVSDAKAFKAPGVDKQRNYSAIIALWC